MQYVVIVERGESSYGAYVPDLPGCMAVAETKEEVLKLIREAIGLHIESMREEALPIPEPAATVSSSRKNLDTSLNRTNLPGVPTGVYF